MDQKTYRARTVHFQCKVNHVVHTLFYFGPLNRVSFVIQYALVEVTVSNVADDASK